jgi:phytoene synthase
MSERVAKDKPSADIAYCIDEVRRHDHGRYLAAATAKADARAALFALYALNLEIAKAGEVTSEALLGEVRIEWWREAVAELFEGMPRQHMVLQALAEALARKPLDRAQFEALIEARIVDLHTGIYPTMAALVHYAEESAGRLAMLALEMLGRTDGGLRDAAWDIGTAWALVGLMRAIPYHGERRRLYLPLDRLKAQGRTPEDVFNRRFGPEIGIVVAEVLAVAKQRIEAARLRCPRPPRWALPVLLQAPLAEAQAHRLAKQVHDPWRDAVSLGHIKPPLLIGWHHLLGRF